MKMAMLPPLKFIETKIEQNNNCSAGSSSGGRMLPCIYTVLVIVLPLVYTDALYDPVLVSRLVASVLLILIGFCYLFAILKKNVYHFTLFDAFWGLYVLLTARSVFDSLDRSLAVLEVLKLLLVYLLYILFRVSLDGNRKFFSTITFILACNCIFQTAVFLAQKIIMWNVFGAENDFAGTMTHLNILAESMLFSFPFVVYDVITRKGKLKIVPVVGSCCALWLIIFLKCRAVWVGLFISLLITGTVLTGTGGVGAIKRWLVSQRLLLLSAGVVFISVTVLICIFDYNDLQYQIYKLIKLDSNGRIRLWTLTVPLIKSHFFWGTGLGNWRLHFQNISYDVFYQRPHNDYLWVLAESGIFALVAFLGTVIVVCRNCIKSVRHSNASGNPIGFTLLFYLSAYMTVSFFAFPKERVFHLVLFALCCARLYNENPIEPLVSIKMRYLAGVTLLIALGMLYFSVNRMASEIKLKQAVPRISTAPRQTIKQFQLIKSEFYQLDGAALPVSFHEGMAWQALGNTDKMIDCLEEGLKANPWNSDILLNLGTGYYSKGESELARERFSKAITTDSFNEHAKINLAILELKNGHPDKCVDLFKRINYPHIEKDPVLKEQYKILKSSLRKWM